MWRRRIRFVTTLVICVGALCAVGMRPEVAFHEVKRAPPPPALPADLEQAVATVEGWYAAPPDLREAYAQWFLASLELQRAQLWEGLERRTMARHAQTSDVLSRIFDALRLASLVLLLLPLVYWRRYAGRRKAFTAYCVLAALMLSVMFQLMGGLLRVAVDLSTYAGSRVNPQHAMLDAAFDLAETRLADWVAPETEGGLPVGPTMEAIESSESGDFLVQLLENLQYFDVEALRLVIDAAYVIHHVFGMIPHLIPVLVSLLFIITTRFLFLRIASMPMRAMRGEAKVGRAALKLALVTWIRELGAVLVFVLSLAIPALSMQLAVRYVGYAVTEASVEQAVSLVDYMGRLTAAPDRTHVTVGMLGIPLTLLICLGVYMLSFVAYSLWSRRITQLRFHSAVPLRGHGGFWRAGWGRLLRIQWSLALLLFFGLPLLLGALEVHPHATSDSALASLFWRGLVGVGAFVLGAVLLGVPRDLWWFLRFRPVRPVDTEDPTAAESSAPEA
ncbi:MAG: hypothetical protein QNJ98_02345 [Planctomycetota bacterium]|nr:hypothetical protein [Planctomycetota bacterium]